jgi:MFS family permease
LDDENSTIVQVFGRRPVMLVSLFIFAVGSAICGAAPSINVLILGRSMLYVYCGSELLTTHYSAIQGVGGGGLASISQIVMSDIVSLEERGKFNGLLGL